MKKPLLLRLFVPAVLLAGFVCSCAERRCDSDPRTPDRPCFTLDEVRRAFAADHAATLRTRTGGEFDEDAVLDPLRIAPDWEAVVWRDGDTLLQAVVPFSARYDYRLLRWDANGRPSLFPLPHRLVVVKDSATGRTGSWLCFEVADPTDCPDPDTPFSGTVLYATLSGFPVSAGRYADGTLLASASLFDDTRTREENVERLSRLLPSAGIHIARLGTRSVTRGVNDDNPIEPVEIIGHAPIKIPDVPTKPEIPENPVVPPFDTRNHLPIGGGGGAPGTSGSDKTYPGNPHITVDDEEIRPALDSLYNDCMGQLLIRAVKNKVTIDYESIQRGSYAQPEILPLPSGPVITGFCIHMGQPLNPMTVMEELMHIYQGLGYASFWQASLNYEIEAKLAWYIYMQKHSMHEDVRRALGGDKGLLHFNTMRGLVLANDWQNPEFFNSYEQAANAIQKTIPTYQQDKYVFDPEYMDMPNLLKLLADCLDK